MKDIYVELTKGWGGFNVGDVVRFGQPKGERIIEQGIGHKVKKQQAVNDPKFEPKIEPPKAETADAILTVEKAVVIPEIKTKAGPPKEKKADEKGGAG